MVSNCRRLIVAKIGTFVKYCLPLVFLAGCQAGDEIYLITREEGSGTRTAFVQITGILENGIDRTSKHAETDASTAVVVQSVASDPNAIGYISFANLCDKVRPLPINGVAPGLETLRNGSYPLVRTFYLAGKGEKSAVAEDFCAFLQSEAAATVLMQNGYAPIVTQRFTSANPKGTLVLAGSSSLAPVMQKLADAYARENSRAKIQIQASDTASGLQALENGLCELAMLSRETREGEHFVLTPVCLDGIAVIVHPQNTCEGLTLAQLCAIYLGEIGSWGEVG